MTGFNKRLPDDLPYAGPMFLYSRSEILAQIAKVRNAFAGQNTRLLYAVKANDYMPVVRLMVRDGFGLHVSSQGEYERVKNLGGYISHTGPFIHQDLPAQKNIHFNLNSLEELSLFGPWSKLGLRVNPECGWSLLDQHRAGDPNSQFGVPYSQIKDTELPAQIVRLHTHSNSDSLKVAPYLEAFAKLLAIALRNPRIQSINLGGGFGIPFKPEDKEFDVQTLTREMRKSVADFAAKTGRKLEIQIECGSYYVREAGSYVFQIRNVVRRKGRYFYYTDGSNVHLQGLKLYRTVTSLKPIQSPEYPACVIGATCMRGDEIASDVLLPELSIGDLLTVANAGAYCAAQANHFNRIVAPAQKLK